MDDEAGYHSALSDSDSNTDEDEFFTVDGRDTGFGTRCLDVDGTHAARRLTDAQMKMVLRINSGRREGFVQDVLEQLARRELKCSICLATIVEGSHALLPCGHMFHYVCIDRAMAQRKVCPVCKASVPDAPHGALACLALRF